MKTDDFGITFTVKSSIEEEILDVVVIKFKTTEPVICFEGENSWKTKHLKEIKSFDNENINTCLLFLSITVIHYKHATKGSPLLMNNTLCWSASEPFSHPLPIQLKMFRIKGVEAYPSMHWVRTLNKSPVHSANTYRKKKKSIYI